MQSHALQNLFPKSVFEFQTSIATIVQSHVLQSQEWWVGGFVCTISAVEAAITPASMMVICMTFAWSMQTESLWPLIPVLPSYGHGHEPPGPRYSSLIHGQYLNDFIITGRYLGLHFFLVSQFSDYYYFIIFFPNNRCMQPKKPQIT